MGEGLWEREGRGERQRAREEGWVKREGEGGRVGTKKRYSRGEVERERIGKLEGAKERQITSAYTIVQIETYYTYQVHNVYTCTCTCVRVFVYCTHCAILSIHDCALSTDVQG